MNPVSGWTPGIDVSHWQGIISWHDVKTAGIQFAYIKASDGANGIDPRFGANVIGSSGLIARGAYHFFRQEDIPAQMENFKIACGAASFELPPALDVEVGPLDDSELKDILLFMNLLEEFAGRIPVLYIDLANFLEISASEFERYPLWLADYSTREPLEPWSFWQHTPQGRIPGIANAVDLDWFRGTPDQLLTIGTLPT